MIVDSASRGVVAQSSAGANAHATSLEGPYNRTVIVGNPLLLSFAEASQLSGINPMSLGGIGTAGILFRNQPEGFAESFFDVTFDLDVPHDFQLVGALFVTGEAAPAAAYSSFSFTGPGTSEVYSVGVDESTTWNVSGTLAPGTYSLSAVAHANDVAPFNGFHAALANYDFLLRLDQVPEPSGFIIWSVIGLAVIGFGWCRRRKTA